MGYKEFIIELLKECDDERKLKQIYTILFIWKDAQRAS